VHLLAQPQTSQQDDEKKSETRLFLTMTTMMISRPGAHFLLEQKKARSLARLVPPKTETHAPEPPGEAQGEGHPDQNGGQQ
jgi:hypothetical protein